MSSGPRAPCCTSGCRTSHPRLPSESSKHAENCSLNRGDAEIRGDNAEKRFRGTTQELHVVFPLITSPRCLRVLRVSAVQTAVLCILHGAGLIAPVAARAQETAASVDIGGMSMRYADSIDATAIALTPTFWTGSRLTSL